MNLKRLFFTAATFLACGTMFAQGKGYTVHRQNKVYLGISGGMNFTGITPTEDYRVLESTPQSSNTSEKTYEKLGANKGSQYGLYMSYSITKKLSVVFQPNFQTNSFNYRTSYMWQDTVNNSDYSIEMMHQQKISSVYLPLMARYDFAVTQFSPYVQGGIYTSIRHHARKNIYYDNTIDEKVDKDASTGSATNQTGDADLTQHINKGNFGITAGAGITYFSNYFAISLESNFRYGFGKIVNDKNRYSDYTGYSVQYLDVLDQMKMYNLDIQLTFMFPIDNSIQLGILKKSRY
jgi:hypothetical protein